MCVCTVVLSFVQFLRLKFYFHVFHVVLETSNSTEENVRMTARSSVNNLLGKIHNKSVIVLIIRQNS
jgi:hypothetical protein